MDILLNCKCPLSKKYTGPRTEAERTKHTLAASVRHKPMVALQPRAILGMMTHGTDRQTNGETPVQRITLTAMDAASVVKIMSLSSQEILTVESSVFAFYYTCIHVYIVAY